MIIYTDTVLRGFLSHVQAEARKLSRLDFERTHHPDATESVSVVEEKRQAMIEYWNGLNEDLIKVLGPEAALKPFNMLAAKGSFAMCEGITDRDPFRITFSKLKYLADKARRKDPSITLLKSWVNEDHKPPEEVLDERKLNRHFR